MQPLLSVFVLPAPTVLSYSTPSMGDAHQPGRHSTVIIGHDHEPGGDGTVIPGDDHEPGRIVCCIK